MTKKFVTIGRGKKCDIIIETASYSRIQTTFVFNDQDNNWYIQDGFGTKSSTNGTWIIIEDELKLNDKMVFRIGKNLIKVDMVNLC